MRQKRIEEHITIGLSIGIAYEQHARAPSCSPSVIVTGLWPVLVCPDYSIPSPYVLAEEVVIERHVMIIGHPMYLPTISASEAVSQASCTNTLLIYAYYVPLHTFVLHLVRKVHVCSLQPHHSYGLLDHRLQPPHEGEVIKGVEIYIPFTSDTRSLLGYNSFSGQYPFPPPLPGHPYQDTWLPCDRRWLFVSSQCEDGTWRWYRTRTLRRFYDHHDRRRAKSSLDHL